MRNNSILISSALSLSLVLGCSSKEETPDDVGFSPGANGSGSSSNFGDGSGGTADAGGNGNSSTGGTDGGSGGTNGGGSEPVPPRAGVPPTCAGSGPISAEFTDPSCDDGKYCEALPDLSVEIGALVDELEAATELSEMTRLGQELLDAGWAFGGDYLRAAGIECHERWADDSWGALTGLEFALHECGHYQDFDDGSRAFEPSADYTLPVPKNDYFGRGEITGDSFHSAIPDAAANDIYFEGSSRSQGIQTTFSEWSQYNHDLGMMYYLYAHDDSNAFIQAEIALNFAWAAPRYLLWARENHPADYDSMMADKEVRDVILTLWGQTFLYYDALVRDTDWSPSAKHTRYIDAMREPELVAIMNELRRAQGCDGL